MLFPPAFALELKDSIFACPECRESITVNQYTQIFGKTPPNLPLIYELETGKQAPFSARAMDDHNDGYIVKVSHDIDEDQQYIETGFEFVTDRDGIKIYRKPK